MLARVSAFEAVPEGKQRRHFVGCEQQGSAEEGEAGEAKRDGGAHSGPTYPEPNLPRLGRTFKKLETSITRPEQSLADTLGRRVKVM